MLLLKNADLYAPEHIGRSDVLLGLNLATKLKFSRRGICSRLKDTARLYGAKALLKSLAQQLLRQNYTRFKDKRIQTDYGLLLILRIDLKRVAGR